MRGALSYLLLRRIKNMIKSVFKSPAKLIYAVVMIGIIILTLWSGGTDSQDSSEEFRDIHELIAGALVLYTVMFILIAKGGFNNGASMFSMPDVNFIFPAPISPKRVLFFGLFQQLWKSLLIGFFILFQYGWMGSVYGVDYGVVLMILLGYALTVFCAQLTAMTIYSFTNSNENRRKLLKILFYGIIAAYVAALLMMLIQDKAEFLSRLVSALYSLPARLFPVSGWIAGSFYGFIFADTSAIVLGLSLYAVYIVSMVILIMGARQDYYEDVLKTTEISYTAAAAARSGQMAERIGRNVKTGKTGLGKGEGADAFYYKHLIENRRARVLLLSGQSLIFALSVIAFSFFMGEAGIIAVFIFATYMQVFGAAMGRLPRELMKQYVYLVPESSFKKLIACMKESFSGMVIEAVVIFVPVALILGLSPVEAVMCMVARISFALLFTAGNLLVERVFGMVSSKMLIILFYFVTLLVMSLPGIFAAILLMSFGIVILTEIVTVMLLLTLFNVPVALLVIFLCKNVLQCAELNTR